MVLMDDRRISVSLACARRVGVGVGAAAERRIAKTIAAASRRHGLALRQGVKAAAQRAVFSDVTAAILVRAGRGRSRGAEKCCAGDNRCAEGQKLFHVRSPACWHPRPDVFIVTTGAGWRTMAAATDENARGA